MMGFWNNRSGAISIYTALVGALVVGGAVLAIDYGRLTVVRSQMQNAADAAALAGAAQLNGQLNAISRATGVATSAATQSSSIVGALTVSNVAVLRQIGPNLAATSDQDARYVRVTMAPEDVNLLFQPVLNLLSGAGASSAAELQAVATARSEPILCPPARVLVCADQLDALGVNITDPAAAGRQLALREQNSAIIPLVVFQQLCPPSQPDCTEAEAIQFAASVGVAECGSTMVTVVQGGVSGPAIDDGMNTRFGSGPAPEPAQNVIFYDRDPDVIAMAAGPFGLTAGAFGDGVWNPDAYWAAKHGGALPGDIDGATRYQVHLYELGEAFARNDKQTIFPPPATPPVGFVTVTPPAADIPVAANPLDQDNEALDGVPDTAGLPVEDPRRRIVTGAVVRCEAQDFTQPVESEGRFVELFLTERSNDSVVFAEVVGPVTPGSSPDMHANVRLVE